LPSGKSKGRFDAHVAREEGEAPMTFEELMQRLKSAKNTSEYITVELDAIAAARNGSITTQERDRLIVESRLMRKRLRDKR
jgi:hypothetical protein